MSRREELIRSSRSLGAVKAHIRKATVLLSLREHTKALEALDVARETDEAAGSKSTREIQELSYKVQSAMSTQRANETEQETMERAMRDPEVAVRSSLEGVPPPSSWCVLRNPLTSVCFLFCFCFFSAGNHDGPSDAEHFAAGAGQPASAAGPHEEPDGEEQDYQAYQRGYRQDAVRSV